MRTVVYKIRVKVKVRCGLTSRFDGSFTLLKSIRILSINKRLEKLLPDDEQPQEKIPSPPFAAVVDISDADVAVGDDADACSFVVFSRLE